MEEKTRKWMYLDDINETIEKLLSNYNDRLHNAMDAGSEDKVSQYHGSIVSLQVLQLQLGLYEDEPEDEGDVDYGCIH